MGNSTSYQIWKGLTGYHGTNPASQSRPASKDEREALETLRYRERRLLGRMANQILKGELDSETATVLLNSVGLK
jgi:hypothetical protein